MLKLQFDTNSTNKTNGYTCETCSKDKAAANYLLNYGDIICGIRLKNMKDVTYLKLYHSDGTNIVFTENLDHIKFYEGDDIIIDANNNDNFVNAYPAVAIRWHHMGYEMDGTADVYFDCVQLWNVPMRHNLISTPGHFQICGQMYRYSTGMFTKNN